MYVLPQVFQVNLFWTISSYWLVMSLNLNTSLLSIPNYGATDIATTTLYNGNDGPGIYPASYLLEQVSPAYLGDNHPCLNSVEISFILVLCPQSTSNPLL